MMTIRSIPEFETPEDVVRYIRTTFPTDCADKITPFFWSAYNKGELPLAGCLEYAACLHNFTDHNNPAPEELDIDTDAQAIAAIKKLGEENDFNENALNMYLGEYEMKRNWGLGVWHALYAASRKLNSLFDFPILPIVQRAIDIDNEIPPIPEGPQLFEVQYAQEHDKSTREVVEEAVYIRLLFDFIFSFPDYTSLEISSFVAGYVQFRLAGLPPIMAYAKTIEVVNKDRARRQ